MSQVNNLITGQWQWVAVLSIATHQKEKESSNVTCTTTPKQQTYVRSFFSFFFFLNSVLGDLPYRYKKAQMRNRKAVNVYVLSAGSYLWKQCWMKYKQRWRSVNSDYLATVPHHNPYNLFNYFQYLHWCTQNTLKKEIFFLVSQCIFKSSGTFRAIRKKKKRNMCILIKKKGKKVHLEHLCLFSCSFYQLVANQVHPGTC